MKTSSKLLLCVTATVVAIIAVSQQFYLWPPVLKRCSINDPDLDNCLLRATEFAIKKVSKGLSMVGLNSLDPLRNAQFKVSSERWPVTVVVEVNQMSIMGTSKLHIRSVTFDRRSGTFNIQGFHESLRTVGNYRVRGSVLLFPINSAGTFDMELRGILANHTLKLSANTRDASHGQVGFDVISLNNMKVVLRDPNLGTAATRALNRVVNDNWKIITRALIPSVERAIHDIYTSALQPLTSKYTVYDFFPNFPVESENDESSSDEDEEEDEEEGPAETEVPVVYSYYIQWK